MSDTTAPLNPKITPSEMNYVVAYFDWLRDLRTEEPNWFTEGQHEDALRRAHTLLVQAFATENSQ